MTEQSYDNIPDSAEIPDLEEVPHIIEGRDLETPIVASIETLKRSNKKCGKEEVLHLVQESVDSEVTKEHFEELLEELSIQRVTKILMDQSMLMKNCKI